MRFLFLVVLLATLFLQAKAVSGKDLTVQKDYEAKFGNINAQVLHFGGVSTPKCQFAISNDGQYFYFTKLISTCKRLKNSKGMKIVCNSDKSVCKTREELKEFISNGKNSALKNSDNPDLTVSKDYQAKFGNIEAQVLHFGGVSTPKCQFAISNDGQYFYFTKLNSTCKRLTNSKGMKIVCNSNKSVCKTRKELIAYIKNPQENRDDKPSWCRAASLNSTEETICNNRALYLLDKKLASLYGASKADSKDLMQKNWLKQRNFCGRDLECIKDKYNIRLSQLKNGNNQSSSSSTKNNRYEKLFNAIKKRDIAAIDKILSNSNLNIIYSDSKAYESLKESRGTPLYYAVKLGYIDIAKILINHGADINQDMIIHYKGYNKKIYKEPFTPLTKAIYDDLNVSTLKNIIKLGADVNKKRKNEEKAPPLYMLMNYKYLNANIVKFFLEHGAKVDIENNAGITPLADLILKMAIHGVDKETQKYKNQYEVIKLLLEHGANPNKQTYTVGGLVPIVDAAGTTLDIVKLLKKHGGKLDTISTKGNTMLHFAKDVSIAKYLINNGLKKYVNYKNDNGYTPIATTIDDEPTKNTIATTKLFLDKGATIPKNQALLDRLYLEYTTSNVEADYRIKYAKLLLSHGANINTKDNQGNTVLDKVLKELGDSPGNYDAKIIDFLINNGAKYKEIHDKEIDNYFKSCNNGNLNGLKKVLAEDSYKNIESEVKGKCKEDKECIKDFMASNYGATKYKIVKKKEGKYFILLIDKEPKLIKLSKTDEGKISLGDK